MYAYASSRKGKHMMNQFIEEQRSFLARMSRMIRVSSLILVVLGTLWAGIKAVALISRLGDWNALCEMWKDTPSAIVLFLLLGIIGLGLASFLRYMYDPEYKPNWIVKRGEKLLYAFAAFVAIQGCVYAGLILYRYASLSLAMTLIICIGYLVFVVGAVLVLAGLAQVYKRLLPMIDEARALV